MIDYSSEQSKKMISDDLKQKPLEAVDALRIVNEIISSICTSIEFSASPVA